ncbi:NYN domain-containing protein [Halospeciosus flavus]|uniref:NYN domain-containing protein n=1 Tax=Halospeciosus flavus TaxID=3032283 RepID=UPI00360A3112
MTRDDAVNWLSRPHGGDSTLPESGRTPGHDVEAGDVVRRRAEPRTDGEVPLRRDARNRLRRTRRPRLRGLRPRAAVPVRLAHAWRRQVRLLRVSPARTRLPRRLARAEGVGGAPDREGVDVALATELIAQGFNDSYDVAVVVSGDADYDRAIRYVQDQGKVVEAAMFEGAASGRLRDAVDDFYPLNEYDERLYRGD